MADDDSEVVAASVVVKEENTHDYESKPDVKPNFLLSSDFYKNLLERAVFSKSGDAVPVFPRNLLYSCFEDSNGHDEVRDSTAPPPSFFLILFVFCTLQKAAYVWGQEQGHAPNGGSPKGPGPHHGPHGPPGGPTQGLVHWMSVMAEHMTNASHDNPVHYMWNNVEVCYRNYLKSQVG